MRTPTVFISILEGVCAFLATDSGETESNAEDSKEVRYQREANKNDNPKCHKLPQGFNSG